MQSAAAPAPPPPPRPRRVYTAVYPPCEWARTEDADILVVDVSRFRKEELKVLYNTSRELKVTGESQVDGARWARFLKVFPVPTSCDAAAIRAMMDKENSVLYVILPKGSSSLSASSSSSLDKQKEQQPGSSQPRGEQKGGAGSADGSSSSSSTGSPWSAQEDEEEDRIEERKMELEVKEKTQEEIATQDVPRTDGGDDANAVKKDDGDGKDKRWWKKIRPLLALGFILALIGLGACVLYVMSL